MYPYLRFHRLAVFTLSTIFLLTLIALFIAHFIYQQPNPYIDVLNYTPEQIRAEADCYTDFYFYSANDYCVEDSDVGYTLFSFTTAGDLESVSFWRSSHVVQVGAFFGWYGTPSHVQHTRWWTAYIWRLSDCRVTITARHDDLYARVTSVVFTMK